MEADEVISKNKLFNGLALPQRLASKPTQDTDIVAIKGRSGLSKGVLSPSMTMMKLPLSSKFHEVWMVRLDGPLGKFSELDFEFTHLTGNS